MPSERVQLYIDRLLNRASEAVADLDWPTVRDRVEVVLRLDPQNIDARPT